MNIQFYIDMLVFSLIYSQLPFFFLDLLGKTGSVFSYDSVSRKTTRHIVVSCISPFVFLWFSKSGWRNRYVLWHLEQNKRRSGLNALEMITVPLYFCMYVFPLEYLTSYLDFAYPMPIHSAWPLHLLSQTSNTFLASALYHMILEYTTFMDAYRANYFIVDRD